MNWASAGERKARRNAEDHACYRGVRGLVSGLSCRSRGRGRNKATRGRLADATKVAACPYRKPRRLSGNRVSIDTSLVRVFRVDLLRPDRSIPVAGAMEAEVRPDLHTRRA